MTCMTCGCNHSTSVCPPDAFIVLTCKKCGNEDLLPGDTLCVGITAMNCGQCEETDWQVRGATIDDLKKHWRNYGKYCQNVRVLDLKKINSATKYPSILTYHGLGEKGRLTEEILVSFEEEDDIVLTEKIDGANCRIILFPESQYLIGSREDLLYFRNDLIVNPSMSIVETVKRIAEDSIRPLWKHLDQTVMTIYGEVYGGKTSSNGKNYSNGKTGFRVFDIAVMGAKEFEELLILPIEKIAVWRDNGGQTFLTQEDLQKICEKTNCPTVFQLESKLPPKTVQETYDWLCSVLPGFTNVPIECEGGKPEGVVVRTNSRSKIAKIRFEDYERTLRKKN